MARRVDGKLKILYVKDILERAGHAVTMREMLERLSERGMSAERKSVSDDIRLLRQYGLPVVVIRRGRFTAYSLKKSD